MSLSSCIPLYKITKISKSSKNTLKSDVGQAKRFIYVLIMEIQKNVPLWKWSLYSRYWEPSVIAKELPSEKVLG